MRLSEIRPTEGTEATAVSPVQAVQDIEELPELPKADDERALRLEQLMTQAMTGELNRARSLKYWENLRLKPKHMQILLMAAAGYTNNMIANKMELTPARVSVILNHPDAQTLLSALVSYSAENLLDVKARIQAHAGEALDIALNVMRNSGDMKVQKDTAFELLKMAGYGAIERKQVDVNASLKMDKKDSSKLISALEESSEIFDVDYEVYCEAEEEDKLDERESEEPTREVA